MAKDVKAFMKMSRETANYRPVEERVKDYKEVFILRDEQVTSNQGTRCMDCGTPFCHDGCPIGNYIPDWNYYAGIGQWAKAFKLLDATNNFPEFTGRVCPAFCETSCVLGINDDPITCKENELGIVEYAFEHGLVKANPPKIRSGKTVAVIGSGPTGLAAADQLNKAGHTVTVFERETRIGGWMRYGIPDFKFDKGVIDRRLNLLEEEGIVFKTSQNIGVDVAIADIQKDFDTVLIAIGTRDARDLTIPGRDLKGVHFAGDFLTLSNKKVAGDVIPADEDIIATDKNVVVIGGGDTGSDCVGTSNRQKATSIYQIEVMPKAPEARTKDMPWPTTPRLSKVTTSHAEGVEQDWEINTKEFIGDENGNLKALKICNIEWINENGRFTMKEIEGTEKVIDCELALLAIGFVGPEHNGMLDTLGVEYDGRGNVVANDTEFSTNVENVFVAGDSRTGQSLVMKCISEGRKAAHAIDKHLMGWSNLPLI